MNRPKFCFKFSCILIVSFLAFFICLNSASGKVTEADSNFDGKMDQWTYMSPEGNIFKVEYDTDFDENIDQIEHFEGNEQMIKAEFDSNKDGQIDQVQHYGNSGKLERVEKDSKHKGAFDWVEFFNEKEDHIGTCDKLKEYVESVNPDLVHEDLPYHHSKFLDEFMLILIDGVDWS